MKKGTQRLKDGPKDNPTSIEGFHFYIFFGLDHPKTDNTQYLGYLTHPDDILSTGQEIIEELKITPETLYIEESEDGLIYFEKTFKQFLETHSMSIDLDDQKPGTTEKTEEKPEVAQ